MDARPPTTDLHIHRRLACPGLCARPALVMAGALLLACAPAATRAPSPPPDAPGAVATAPAAHAATTPPPEVTAPGPEQSVKPGINDSWRSGRVASLVGRLESESREVWTERARIVEVVGARPGMVVADIGSGSGFLTELLARAVGPTGKVHALDINPRLLANIDTRARAAGLGNIETMHTPEASTPLAPGSVDLVFMCDAYHHLEFPRSTMRSIFAALRPGGELVLVDLERIPGTTSPSMLEHVRAGKEVFLGELIGDGFELVTEHEVPELEENYVLRLRKPPQ